MSSNKQDLAIRTQFLETFWDKYPFISAKDQTSAGRFLKFKDQSELVLFSLYGDTLHQIIEVKCESKLFVGSQKELLWSDILIPGDLISINNKNQIQMLAPMKSKNGLEQTVDQIVSKKMSTQKLWNKYIYLVRKYFNNQGFDEVQTPSMVDNPGQEPTLENFSTELFVGKRKITKYLPTSPEIHLKKALAMGVPKIFEITRCYRNNENSDRHQPEFWMIEWYRTFSSNEDIKTDIIKLIQFLLNEFQKMNLLSDKKFPEVQSISFEEFFKNRYNFLLTPDISFEDLKRWAVKEGLYLGSINTIQDLFSLVTLEKVENFLTPEKIIFLEKYPSFAAALARLDNDGWAERFELYWKGLEIANSFCELNDPDEQLVRIKNDNQLRQQNGLPELEADFEFIEALKNGIPPSSGVALGLDRLFMVLFDITDISETKFFPYQLS